MSIGSLSRLAALAALGACVLVAMSSQTWSCIASSSAIRRRLSVYIAIHAVPSGWLTWPPVGSGCERSINARLLIRSTRKLTLTDAGSAYLQACKRILEQVGDAERAASGEYVAPRGDLVVTAPVVFGRLHVLPVVSDFLAAFSEINVQLALSDRNVHLIDDHVDAAVRIGPLADMSLIATRVGFVRRVVCGSPAYFATHGAPKSPADLSDLACVTFDVLGSPVSWNFPSQASKAELAVPVRSRLSVNTAEAAVDAAIAGVRPCPNSRPAHRLKAMVEMRPPTGRVSPDYPCCPFQRAVPTTPADRTGACVDGLPVRAAFPKCTVGRRPHWFFRGLLRLHSRYGPPDRSTARGGLCHEASARPVTQPNRSSATGLIDNYPDGTSLH